MQSGLLAWNVCFNVITRILSILCMIYCRTCIGLMGTCHKTEYYYRMQLVQSTQCLCPRRWKVHEILPGHYCCLRLLFWPISAQFRRWQCPLWQLLWLVFSCTSCSVSSVPHIQKQSRSQGPSTSGVTSLIYSYFHNPNAILPAYILHITCNFN